MKDTNLQIKKSQKTPNGIHSEKTHHKLSKIKDRKRIESNMTEVTHYAQGIPNKIIS